MRQSLLLVLAALPALGTAVASMMRITGPSGGRAQAMPAQAVGEHKAEQLNRGGDLPAAQKGSALSGGGGQVGRPSQACHEARPVLVA